MMQISKAMNAKLNEQITAEFAASHKYLAMACAFDGMGLKYLRNRFFKQQEEEHGHAMKVLRYVLEVGGTVKPEGAPKPKSDYKSVGEMVKAAVESEEHVTRLIHELVALAEKEHDYATRSFLNWFVDEQVEEISTMTDLLRIVELAGDNVLQVEGFVRHQLVEAAGKV
jgi:bacterioferritin B